MSSTEVTIPHDWTPRPHQRALFDQFGHGKTYRRGCAVWHRRAGKDSCALNLTARDMCECRRYSPQKCRLKIPQF
jgi:hypothetical protein